MKRAMQLILLFLTFVSWCLGGNLPVRAATVDLPTYVQRLTTARDAITQARNQGAAGRDTSIRRATDALNGIDSVTVDGATYAPQLDEARESLRATTSDLDRSLTLVTTLHDTAAATMRSTPDPAAHGKLDDVLRDRDFHQDQPNVVQQQVLRFRNWLGEQFRRLTAPLRRINPPNPNLPTPSNVPGVTGFAAVLAALGSPQALIAYAVIIALALTVIVWRRRPKGSAVDTRAVPERTAREWRDYAAELAARGEHRAAIRSLLLGVLRDLDERGIVPFDPARTDREYLRAVSEHGEWLAEPFRPLVRLVEGVFYGGAPCGHAEYERARAEAEALRAVVGEAQAFAGIPA